MNLNLKKRYSLTWFTAYAIVLTVPARHRTALPCYKDNFMSMQRSKVDI